MVYTSLASDIRLRTIRLPKASGATDAGTNVITDATDASANFVANAASASTRIVTDTTDVYTVADIVTDTTDISADASAYVVGGSTDASA